MTIDDIMNTTVMLILINYKGFEELGIQEDKFYAKVVGRDSLGIWIENPKLETTRVRDDDGMIIPPECRQHVEHIAHVLIPWEKIRSIVHFPLRRDLHTSEDEEAKLLGRGLYL